LLEINPPGKPLTDWQTDNLQSFKGPANSISSEKEALVFDNKT